MKLNEKVFYCRRKAGLSQEALAEELGVSRQAVSKWETGDAVPEISKLLSLAKTFDVTTDWLLSEEEPEEGSSNYYQESVIREAGAADNSTSAERFEKAADDWMDRVPGVLGKLVKRFGWIAGVYIAACGAGFTMLGLLAKVMVRSMANSFQDATNSMMSGFGGFGGSSMTFYDENGNQLSASESAELAELFGSNGSFGFGSGSIDSYLQTETQLLEGNPVSVMATFMIVFGLILLIGGSIFAVSWYKKSKAQH